MSTTTITRRIITVLALTIALVGAVLLATATKSDAADHRPVVTAGEWSQIKPGMGKARVANILDGPGRLWWTANDGHDQYRVHRAAFGDNHLLVVWYDNYSNGRGMHVWDRYRSTNPFLTERNWY